MNTKATLISLALTSLCSVAIVSPLAAQPMTSDLRTRAIIAHKGADDPRPEPGCDDLGTDICSIPERVARKGADDPQPEPGCDDHGTDVCLGTSNALPQAPMLLARERSEGPRRGDNERAGNRQGGRRK